MMGCDSGKEMVNTERGVSTLANALPEGPADYQTDGNHVAPERSALPFFVLECKVVIEPLLSRKCVRRI